MTKETSSLQDTEPRINFLGGNEGTHYPFYYKYGPGIVPNKEEETKIFTERDEYGPNHVTYDLEDKDAINSGGLGQSKFESKPAEVVKKVYSRNVNGRTNRKVKRY